MNKFRSVSPPGMCVTCICGYISMYAGAVSGVGK